MAFLSPSESFVDVLIIGAGPAGLMCANALSLAGIEVRIVDQKAVPISSGHADGVHSRTMEIIQSYGLAERLLREGTRFDRAAFYTAGADGGIIRTQRTHAVFAPTSRHPFPVTRHQGGIEALFRDSMAKKGVIVERPVIPTAIELSNGESGLENHKTYPVKVTLKHLDSAKGESEIVHAKFVLGSDGAHSWVRKAFNIPMDGDQTDSIWGVVEIIPETDFPDLRNWAIIQSNHGTLMNIPREGDLVRFYIQLPPDTDLVNPDTGRVDVAKASAGRLMECAAKILHPFTVKQVGEAEWWTVYMIGQRVARSCSVRDRVFIAGDACHTHSPKAGQGMNASMCDTHNLGMVQSPWKLAYVLRGWAGMSLLKTYESERLKYARDLIEFDRKWSKFFRNKPQSEENEDGASQEEFVRMLETSHGFMSGTAIRYEPSAIVDPRHQSYASKLIVGERMLPHDFLCAANAVLINIHDMLPSDARFKILVFLGDISVEATMDRARALAIRMDAPEGFLRRFGQGAYEKVFDVLSICATKNDKMDFTDVPKFFRSHWSKALLDDKEMSGRGGGGGYEAYGIDPAEGAIVVVRPDGYVGMVAPFEHLDDISGYFATFMLERPSA
uniref:p-hydroxybenzoate hydroxylase n=1 Tax=Ganoderma boninense TaxID=34458 RepID=A0A5K1JYZ6_9APHY|nr:p-hydroxybenzoate hydroxylase [Ganoderma boninense]